MSAHVLFACIKRVGESDNKRGLPSMLSLFRNEFDKFNCIRARMLDYFYDMTLNLLRNGVLCVTALIFCHIYTTLLRPSLHSVTKICKPLVFYPF